MVCIQDLLKTRLRSLRIGAAAIIPTFVWMQLQSKLAECGAHLCRRGSLRHAKYMPRLCHTVVVVVVVVVVAAAVAVVDDDDGVVVSFCPCPCTCPCSLWCCCRRCFNAASSWLTDRVNAMANMSDKNPGRRMDDN